MVERTLGKGEAESSILSRGTIHSFVSQSYRHTPDTCADSVGFSVACLDASGDGGGGGRGGALDGGASLFEDIPPDPFGFGPERRRLEEERAEQAERDRVACLTNAAFLQAVSHPDFYPTLAEAVRGDLEDDAEYSFVFGPLFGFGSNGFSSPDTLGNPNSADGGPTFTRPLPLIGFHTHRNAAPYLSQFDRDAAVNLGYPTVAFDIDDRTFRCALP